MTNYQKLMDQADFYTTEARKHKDDPIKKMIFKWLAKKYTDKALRLPIMEALR